jgi:hypothetical protein
VLHSSASQELPSPLILNFFFNLRESSLQLSHSRGQLVTGHGLRDIPTTPSNQFHSQQKQRRRSRGKVEPEWGQFEKNFETFRILFVFEFEQYSNNSVSFCRYSQRRKPLNNSSKQQIPKLINSHISPLIATSKLTVTVIEFVKCS